MKLSIHLYRAVRRSFSVCWALRCRRYYHP